MAFEQPKIEKVPEEKNEKEEAEEKKIDRCYCETGTNKCYCVDEEGEVLSWGETEEEAREKALELVGSARERR